MHAQGLDATSLFTLAILTVLIVWRVLSRRDAGKSYQVGMEQTSPPPFESAGEHETTVPAPLPSSPILVDDIARLERMIAEVHEHVFTQPEVRHVPDPAALPAQIRTTDKPLRDPSLCDHIAALAQQGMKEREIAERLCISRMEVKLALAGLDGRR